MAHVLGHKPDPCKAQEERPMMELTCERRWLLQASTSICEGEREGKGNGFRKLETLFSLPRLRPRNPSPHAKLPITLLHWQRNGAHQEEPQPSPPVLFWRYLQDPPGFSISFSLCVENSVKPLCLTVHRVLVEGGWYALWQWKPNPLQGRATFWVRVLFRS